MVVCARLPTYDLKCGQMLFAFQHVYQCLYLLSKKSTNNSSHEYVPGRWKWSFESFNRCASQKNKYMDQRLYLYLRARKVSVAYFACAAVFLDLKNEKAGSSIKVDPVLQPHWKYYRRCVDIRYLILELFVLCLSFPTKLFYPNGF